MSIMDKIRVAETHDLPVVKELAHAIWPVAYGKMISAAQIRYMLERMYSEESLEEQQMEGAVFLLAYSSGTPCGFAAYQDMGAGEFKLHKLYVLPSLHGTGWGKKLLEEVLKRSEQAGGKKIVLQVNRNNPARRFYEKMGFSVAAEADFDIGGGFFMNDYIMERPL